MSAPAPRHPATPAVPRTGVRLSLSQAYVCLSAVAATVGTSTAVVIWYAR